MKALACVLFAMLAAGVVRAAVPPSINFQGRLLDNGGAPVNGAVPVAVTVWSADTGGSLLFTQHVGSVTVENGLYDFEWGNGGLADALTNAQCWLQVHVNSETLAPRQRLLAVPYAVNADQLSDAGKADVFGSSSVTTLVDNAHFATVLESAGTGGSVVNEYTSSGTWTKPARGSLAYVEVWGGGGAGGFASGTYPTAAGGGGGQYAAAVIPLAMLGATEAVTVGQGGGSIGNCCGNGASGGNSALGEWVFAEGGVGGVTAYSTSVSGGRGGTNGSYIAVGTMEAGSSGGGQSYAANPAGNGGGAKMSGAGGGGASRVAGSSGGVSLLGGDGGSGSLGEATDGQFPGGGGGATTQKSYPARSGAGGHGFVRITVW